MAERRLTHPPERTRFADDLTVLWQELELGATTVPNRVVFAAHGVGLRGAEYAHYLAERARGGAGLLITGAAAVDATSDAGLVWSAWKPEAVPDMRLAATAVHEEGRPLFVQLSHTGVQFRGPRSVEDWGRMLAPSALPSPFFDVMPKAMEHEDIERVVAGFVRSTRHVREAGADGVEIHAAHGTLLCAFLSPLTNVRTDDYGGDTMRRARLALEIGAAVRRECGDDFTVGIKLSFDEFLGDAGITPDEAAQTVRLLCEAGYFDYFGISCGSFHSFHHVVVPASSGLSKHTAAYGAIARKVVAGKVPVMVTGTVRTPDDAASLVGSGCADLVGMIRAHIADPEIVRKAQAGRREEIRRCVGANQGCWRRVALEGLIACTVNPATGREATWGISTRQETRTPRRILVVGGGPAGMKLAETAATRGHQVTLVERSPVLGGQARFAGMLPYRESWLHLVDDLDASLSRLGVDVRPGVEIGAREAIDHEADATFVATGSVWDMSGYSIRRPGSSGIPRTAGSRVIDPIAAVSAPDACGSAVTIVDDDGGYLPLGLAEHLALTGHRVTIVTSAETAGNKLGTLGTVDLAWVWPRLLDAEVELVTSVHVDAIEADHVVLADTRGRRQIELQTDTVVLVMMRHPDDELYGEIRTTGAVVHRLGDCVAPREIDDAIFEGVREGFEVEARAAPDSAFDDETMRRG